MSTFDKIFRRKSQLEGPMDFNLNGANKQTDATTRPTDAKVALDATAARQYPAAPSQPRNPASAAGHSYPQTQSQMQNAGMMVGGAVGMMGGGGGGNMGGDIVTGGVVGGMVGQRLAQAENHRYWSGQAMEYRAQLASGERQPVSNSPAKETSWWSREGREQRRMKRWERRAKRRDGTSFE